MEESSSSLQEAAELLNKQRKRSGPNYKQSKHTHNCFIALWILSGTTRVSRYQKKYSPTHTHRGHQYFVSTIHGILPIQSTCFTVFFHNLSPSFLWSTSWPGTLHFILHTFLHPVIVFFSQDMPIPSQPVLL